MYKDHIAVIDLETTGLSPWQHDRVVEIAIVVISPDGRVQIEYETLVNPTRDIGRSSYHRIFAADVLRAPTFANIAGDVLKILAAVSVVAGHNVNFDKNFLIKEYERLGVSIPEIPLLCTYHLSGLKLKAYCDELGIVFTGMPHRALSDARATAQIVSRLCSNKPKLLNDYRLRNVQWPSIPALKTPCFNREHAQEAHEEPPNFLQRISRQIRHDVEAEAPDILTYMALIDRVLEDRTIDKSEEDALVDAALNLKLSHSQLEAVHSRYIYDLAVIALANGIVTDSERRDLQCVAKLLGQDDSALDSILELATVQLAMAPRAAVLPQNENGLCGQRVCFTGELQSTIEGEPITEDLAKKLAMQAGLTAVDNVTKKLDILVVADPHTQSDKAKKARKYRIRILSEVVFWRLAGITVD